MRISLIGLGNMGAPMAANLLKAGHNVTGFDLVTAALQAHAARQAARQVAGSAVEAVAEADAVITMLPAGQHVAEVYETAILPAAKPGALLIDSSTIDVETARLVAGKAAEAGFDMMDAPVSGGVGGAVAGTLTFMVGGSAAGFARALPLLQAMGKTIVHAGERRGRAGRENLQQHDPGHFHARPSSKPSSSPTAWASTARNSSTSAPPPPANAGRSPITARCPARCPAPPPTETTPQASPPPSC